MEEKYDSKGVLGYVLMYITLFVSLIVNIVNIKLDLYDLKLVVYPSIFLSIALSLLSSIVFKKGLIHRIYFVASNISIGIMMGGSIAYGFYLLQYR